MHEKKEGKINLITSFNGKSFWLTQKKNSLRLKLSECKNHIFLRKDKKNPVSAKNKEKIQTI